ncbi:hypothetical protein [Lactobacillus panisapium]|nr:hypothetical protein [Lactobacillus panisapium]
MNMPFLLMAPSLKLRPISILFWRKAVDRDRFQAKLQDKTLAL